MMTLEDILRFEKYLEKLKDKNENDRIKEDKEQRPLDTEPKKLTPSE